MVDVQTNHHSSHKEPLPWSILRRSKFWVVYLSPAANSAGPVWSRPHDVNRTVMPSHIGFARPGPGCVPWLRAHVMRSSSRSPHSPPLTPPAAAATAARDSAALL